LGYICYQGIGLAIIKWCADLSQEDKSEVWDLLDEVNPRIRKAFEHWINSMLGDIDRRL
jgi:hypothetical protein